MLKASHLGKRDTGMGGISEYGIRIWLIMLIGGLIFCKGASKSLGLSSSTNLVPEQVSSSFHIA